MNNLINTTYDITKNNFFRFLFILFMVVLSVETILILMGFVISFPTNFGRIFVFATASFIVAISVYFILWFFPLRYLFLIEKPRKLKKLFISIILSNSLVIGFLAILYTLAIYNYFETNSIETLLNLEFIVTSLLLLLYLFFIINDFINFIQTVAKLKFWKSFWSILLIVLVFSISYSTFIIFLSNRLGMMAIGGISFFITVGVYLLTLIYPLKFIFLLRNIFPKREVKNYYLFVFSKIVLWNTLIIGFIVFQQVARINIFPDTVESFVYALLISFEILIVTLYFIVILFELKNISLYLSSKYK